MRVVKYHWNLRQLMADRGLYATTDLLPLLTDRGIELSASQAFRLVTGTPERLSLPIMAALCDALACEPSELFEPYAVAAKARTRRAAGETKSSPADLKRPTPARIVKE